MNRRCRASSRALTFIRRPSECGTHLKTYSWATGFARLEGARARQARIDFGYPFSGYRQGNQSRILGESLDRLRPCQLSRN
jgi:hypothetical protein